MRALARHFAKGETSSVAKALEDKWGIAGLLHDADYEMTKEKDPKKTHTTHVLAWLKELDAEMDIYDAVAAHAWGYVDHAPQPTTKMQWSLYCCDELTGLIVAVTLVKPDKRLASVTVDSIMRKWSSKSFAAGVDRAQIEQCEPRLGIELRVFIQIALTAMQAISVDLGL